MWVNRGARAVILAGLLLALTPAASEAAAPGVIPGDPLQIYMDGVGHLQVQVTGFPTPELYPANLNLADPMRRAGLVVRMLGGGTWRGCQPGPSLREPERRPIRTR